MIRKLSNAWLTIGQCPSHNSAHSNHLIRYGGQEDSEWQDSTPESGDGFPEREILFRSSEQAKNFQHITDVSLAFWLPGKNPSLHHHTKILPRNINS